MIAAAWSVIDLCWRTRLISAGALAAAVLASGCGKPFNVKTQPSLPAVSNAASVSVDDINVEANAITDEDFLYDTFDANLIAAGILPVRVKLTNSGGVPIDLKNARFELQTQSRSTKAAGSRKAFKRLISYYGISLYTKSGYNESLEAFSSYALDLTNPLSPAQTREGLVFFVTKNGIPAGPTLIISRLKPKPAEGRVSLKLN